MLALSFFKIPQRKMKLSKANAATLKLCPHERVKWCFWASCQLLQPRKALLMRRNSFRHKTICISVNKYFSGFRMGMNKSIWMFSPHSWKNSWTCRESYRHHGPTRLCQNRNEESRKCCWMVGWGKKAEWDRKATPSSSSISHWKFLADGGLGMELMWTLTWLKQLEAFSSLKEMCVFRC